MTSSNRKTFWISAKPPTDSNIISKHEAREHRVKLWRFHCNHLFNVVWFHCTEAPLSRNIFILVSKPSLNCVLLHFHIKKKNSKFSAMLYHEPHWTAKEPWKTSKLPSGGHSSFLNSTVALCNIYYLKSNKVCETNKAWNLLCYSSQAKFLSVLFLLAKMYFSKNLIMRGVLHSTQKKKKKILFLCSFCKI